MSATISHAHQLHHAALGDAIEHAMRAGAAAKAASQSAPDEWRRAVLDQAHEQMLSILARLRQVA